MDIATCPACGGGFENDIRLSGQVIECPHCALPMQMPYASPKFASVPDEPIKAAPQSYPAAVAQPAGKLLYLKRRFKGKVPARAIAVAGIFLGGMLGIYCGMWILRESAPYVFAGFLERFPQAHYFADRLP